MEDRDSGFSNACVVCGKTLPAQCDVSDCPSGEVETAKEVACECGQTAPCDKSPCLLSHAAEMHECLVCGRLVSDGATCERPDCPRTAAANIRNASLDTPFKLGL